MSLHPYIETRIREDLRIRTFSSRAESEDLIWHRDAENRILTVLEGTGWQLQFDGDLPVDLRPGDTHAIPREMWHRVKRSDSASSLTVEVREVGDHEILDVLVEAKKKSKRRRPGNPDYYKGGTRKSNKQMSREINKCSKEPRPASCYDEWSADKTYKKARKTESAENSETQLLETLLNEFYEEEVLLEGLSKKVRETLKKKAEKANMPLGALTGVYRKGLAAWLTGHRQGTPQHAWAMGRVNSFIRGGKARGVDKSEWKKVQKHRSK